jgi:hypothetical protein
MGKYVGSLLITACVAFAAPASAEPVVGDAPSAKGTVAVQQVGVQAPAFRDQAAMVLVGSALIGLAAAVRRAAA